MCMTQVLAPQQIILLGKVGNRDAAMPHQHLADPPTILTQAFIRYSRNQPKG